MLPDPPRTLRRRVWIYLMTAVEATVVIFVVIALIAAFNALFS